MALNIKCNNCRTELEQPGAVLVSPPAVNDPQQMAVNKYQLCGNCWVIVHDWLRNRGLLV